MQIQKINWKLNLVINGKPYLLAKFGARSLKSYPTSLFCEKNRYFFSVKILIHSSSKFHKNFAYVRSIRDAYFTAQKMKFSIKNFFSKCDQTDFSAFGHIC